MNGAEGAVRPPNTAAALLSSPPDLAAAAARSRSRAVSPTAHPPLHHPSSLVQAAEETPSGDALSGSCATSLILSLQQCATSGGLAPAEGSACCTAMGDAVREACAGKDLQAALGGDSDPEAVQVQAQM